MQRVLAPQFRLIFWCKSVPLEFEKEGGLIKHAKRHLLQGLFSRPILPSPVLFSAELKS
jgi:hypothetical protein